MITLYLRYSFEKDFEDLQEIKTLKFAGDWEELQKNVYLKNADKIIRKCQEIKRNWPGHENLHNFLPQYQSFISGRETGY